MIIPLGLNLRHIRVFLAVAQQGSVSAAARRLNVSQPALSKTVADTERLIGQPLFRRTGRKMVLTAPGAIFLRHALDAMRNLENGLKAVSGDGPDDVLSVGVLPTVAASLFPAVVQDFREARRSAYISVTTGPHGHLLDKLRRGDIELMIGRMPEPDEMAGLRFSFLYEDTIELVARADHPGLSRKVRHILRDYPVILPNRASIIRKIVDGFLSAEGIDGVTPALETVSLNLALPLLQSTDMTWFISKGVVARELQMGTLGTFDITAGYMTGAVGITMRSDKDTSTHAAYLIELLNQRGALS
ncbi:Hca operon transcriptional activator (plasmid) [Roseivivax sp. THAF40]|uniref:LysR substrate-binding domain-containing protein n=1 Tax=unclassified Roseivivax TaxID=2639302 RepID=UPI0012690E4F|nr:MULTISPECIES: LysR substrate-binding domain-containing protein [unclassified Roseivivax]QFS84935.1 Hca operon transcriptional activator [Roseivivax sp. THAF197b]QFT48636.1 Hca operon transcriptional activator [Roseivivax sp. THAF40]